MFNLAVSADVITVPRGRHQLSEGDNEGGSHEVLCYTKTTESEYKSSAVNLSLFNSPGDESDCRFNLPGKRGCHVIYFWDRGSSGLGSALSSPSSFQFPSSANYSRLIQQIVWIPSRLLEIQTLIEFMRPALVAYIAATRNVKSGRKYRGLHGDP